MKPEHERRQLMYLQWEDKFKKEKPYQIVSENIPELDGLARSNINMIEGPEELIENIRGRESTFTLDQNGFQILTHQFPSIDYQSNDEVENMYEPEIERLLKEEVSAMFAAITSCCAMLLPQRRVFRVTLRSVLRSWDLPYVTGPAFNTEMSKSSLLLS